MVHRVHLFIQLFENTLVLSLLFFDIQEIYAMLYIKPYAIFPNSSNWNRVSKIFPTTF